MNYEAPKIRLIMELRRQGIADTRVLAAIERVPRDQFVPDAFKDQAYDNIALPIDQGQTISQPYVVAYMTQELRVGDRMTVLEIGTGSGYQTAVLAHLCRRVCTMERYRSLLIGAERRLQSLRLHNFTTRYEDGQKGWPELAPFERIIVTAAPEKLPETLLHQLSDGGMMVAPEGPSWDQRLVRVTRRGDRFERERLIGVRFVPLVDGVSTDPAAARE